MADHIEKRKMPSLGPHGVGDPDDRTLRKTEKNVLIPQLRRKIVREEKCSKDIEGNWKHKGLFAYLLTPN